MSHKLPQLDGVRGIAVLMVVFLHASDKYPTLGLQPYFRNGWMGVDLFFVLSGFLITRILLETKESGHYFRNFYARRCLRIWPLYYSVLLLMFVLIPLARPSDAAMVFESRSSPWWAYPLFLQNFLVPVPTMATGPLGVTWSLAIEEQFYLLWPLVVRYCTTKQLRRIAIAVICVSPVLRFVLSAYGVNIYTNLFCRLDGLMAGALIAICLTSPAFEPRRYTRLAWLGGLVMALLAVAVDRIGARWIVLSFTATAATCLIFLALFSRQRWLRALLTNRCLVWTGMISYGIYLLHKIPFDMAQSFHLGRHPAWMLASGIAAAYGLAAVSWFCLERPFLAMKKYFRSGPVQQADAGPRIMAGHALGFGQE